MLPPPSLILILSLLTSSNLIHASAIPTLIPAVPQKCPCFTATSYVSNAACPSFTQLCIVPLCLAYSTTTIPGPNPTCTQTRTTRQFLPCETACPQGCGATNTVTETALSSCLVSKSLPSTTVTPSNPITLSSTPVITTSSPSLTPSPTPSPSTSTRTRTRPCLTLTLTLSTRCPEDFFGCPPPDCIAVSTTLVPPGPVAGCTGTVTEKATRTCKGRCDGSCGTLWLTQTATAW
ncbi:hypothetical protein IQ07DRAFT_263631 [Pyrenochaeta sp. DS3sAY3a]|nr:hypothetical protein IQ07DRAFT_263631 [Pyrenochaeta sp. DS3sAY3a]